MLRSARGHRQTGHGSWRAALETRKHVGCPQVSYHTEAGSAAVEQMVLRAALTIFISRVSVIEVQSAFAGKVRSGVISAGDAAGLQRRFLEDIVNGVFGVVALTGDHYDQAGELVERHGASLGLRTLDSLQLAVALSLHRAYFAPSGN